MPDLGLPELWGTKAAADFLAASLSGSSSPVQQEQPLLVTYWFAAQQYHPPPWADGHGVTHQFCSCFFSSCCYLPASAKATQAAEPPWGCAGESAPVSSACPTALQCWWRLMGLSSSLHARENVIKIIESKKKSQTYWKRLETFLIEVYPSENRPVHIKNRPVCARHLAMGQLQHQEAFHLTVAVLLAQKSPPVKESETEATTTKYFK